MSEISKREKELTEMTQRLLSSEPQSIAARMQGLRQATLGRIRDLRKYLSGECATARVHLIKHVESIVMEPDGKAYVASGRWNLLGDRRWECAEGQS